MTPPGVRKWIRRTGKSACATGCRAEARRYILRRAAGPAGGGVGHIARMPFPGSYLWGNSAVYEAIDGRSSYP
jgi:hypothetical protein